MTTLRPRQTTELDYHYLQTMKMPLRSLGMRAPPSWIPLKPTWPAPPTNVPPLPLLQFNPEPYIDIAANTIGDSAYYFPSTYKVMKETTEDSDYLEHPDEDVQSFGDKNDHTGSLKPTTEEYRLVEELRSRYIKPLEQIFNVNKLNYRPLEKPKTLHPVYSPRRTIENEQSVDQMLKDVRALEQEFKYINYLDPELMMTTRASSYKVQSPQTVAQFILSPQMNSHYLRAPTTRSQHLPKHQKHPQHIHINEQYNSRRHYPDNKYNSKRRLICQCTTCNTKRDVHKPTIKTFPTYTSSFVTFDILPPRPVDEVCCDDRPKTWRTTKNHIFTTSPMTPDTFETTSTPKWDITCKLNFD